MADPLKNCGFTPQQITDALEYCDNDRDRALGYLKKQKKGGGKLSWTEKLTPVVEAMPAGHQCKVHFENMLWYDNVPIKQKQFKNFCKNSFALTRDTTGTVDKMWEIFEPLVRKAPPAAPVPAPAPPPEAAETTTTKKDKKEKKSKKEKKDGAEKKSKKRKADDGEGKPAKKKKKKDEDPFLPLLRRACTTVLKGEDGSTLKYKELRKAAAKRISDEQGEKAAEVKEKFPALEALAAALGDGFSVKGKKVTLA